MAKDDILLTISDAVEGLNYEVPSDDYLGSIVREKAHYMIEMLDGLKRDLMHRVFNLPIQLGHVLVAHNDSKDDPNISVLRATVEHGFIWHTTTEFFSAGACIFHSLEKSIDYIIELPYIENKPDFVYVNSECVSLTPLFVLKDDAPNRTHFKDRQDFPKNNFIICELAGQKFVITYDTTQNDYNVRPFSVSAGDFLISGAAIFSAEDIRDVIFKYKGTERINAIIDNCNNAVVYTLGSRLVSKYDLTQHKFVTHTIPM